jgi:hypothetical protein
MILFSHKRPGQHTFMQHTLITPPNPSFGEEITILRERPVPVSLNPLPWTGIGFNLILHFERPGTT